MCYTIEIVMIMNLQIFLFRRSFFFFVKKYCMWAPFIHLSFQFLSSFHYGAITILNYIHLIIDVDVCNTEKIKPQSSRS